MPCIGVTLYHPIVTPPLQGCAGLERRSRAAGAAFSRAERALASGERGVGRRQANEHIKFGASAAAPAGTERNRRLSFFA